MSRQAKFLLSCFIAGVVLWLAYIGGLVTATVFAYRMADDPKDWITAIWLVGGTVAAVTFLALGFFAAEVRRAL